MSGGIDSPQPDVDWPANRVRDTFIKFFEEKNHVDWKSSPVVPVNDPTLLFANAGTQNPHLITIFNIISFQFCHFLLI
jgi:alanyl-tRNA synthetase